MECINTKKEFIVDKNKVYLLNTVCQLVVISGQSVEDVSPTVVPSVNRVSRQVHPLCRLALVFFVSNPYFLYLLL